LAQELNAYIEAVLGPAKVIADRSWAHGKSLVLEVLDGHGVVWFVKQHRDLSWYRSELFAYRRWVPALGARAPVLRACDDDLRSLVLSAVPGESADWRHQAVHREAGVVLRRLHDAESIGRWEDLAADKQEELERWAAGAGGLLTGRELGFARSQLRALEHLAAPVRVPCHLDYTPRNWLVAGRRVGVVDFEEAAPDVWINDLGRLYFGWWRNPLASGQTVPAGADLQEAFLDGYGRHPTDEELFLLRACYALTAVRLVVLARQLHQVRQEAAVRAVLGELMTKTYGG